MYDHRRIERLYREHHAPTLALLRRRNFARLYDQCEDALSQAWLILERKETEQPGYIREQSAGHWLYVVAQRELWSMDRAYRRDRPESGWADAIALLPATFDTEREALSRVELGELVDLLTHGTDYELHGNQLTAMMPLGRRQALLARMIGLSYQETAAATGRTYTAVNRHTTEGRRKAREILA